MTAAVNAPYVGSDGDQPTVEIIKCPSCGARQLGCFIREAEIGSWCCGDCTAHQGQHDWNGTDCNPPEELT